MKFNVHKIFAAMATLGVFYAQAQMAPMSPAAPASGTAPSAPVHDMSSMPAHDMSSMPGDDMSSMKNTDDMSSVKGMAMGEHEMQSALGPYSMTREGSGTSWQPDATPMMGQHMMKGDWSLMAHGFVNALYDKQTGPRGDKKSSTESMFMLMGNRPVGPGTLGLRATVSLNPT